MKSIVLLLSLIVSIHTYDRTAAVNYAHAHVHNINHDCSTGSYGCSPFGYFGNEHCGYSSLGGDCANFVSQCLLAGGHPKLKGGQCRGYPCGKEEIGAWELGHCLPETFGWKSECGYTMKPPSYIKAGDVLVYHAGSCTGDGHATLVTKVSGGNAYITCHSSEQEDIIYTYMTSKPYYQWIHYNGGEGGDTPSTKTYTVVAGDTLSAIALRFGTTVKAICDLNGITNPDIINVGQVLLIP